MPHLKRVLITGLQGQNRFRTQVRYRSEHSPPRIAAPVALIGNFWQLFGRVLITDLQGQNRFRTQVRYGSEQSPSATSWAMGSGASERVFAHCGSLCWLALNDNIPPTASRVRPAGRLLVARLDSRMAYVAASAFDSDVRLERRTDTAPCLRLLHFGQ
jgi:hypothetical protein